LRVDAPPRILVIEDEILIALGLELLAEDAGYEPLGIATTAEDAIELARSRPEVALVDIQLADGPTGIEMARKLAAQGTAVLFTTANLRRIPEDFAGALGVVAKPYTERSVSEALAFMADHVAGRAGELPDGLSPAPSLKSGTERPAAQPLRGPDMAEGARAVS
jgi:CheY-like chemotaxis protein